MPFRYANPTAETHAQPLTIGNLLNSTDRRDADQVIVYRDQKRLTYTDLRDRIGRLATTLEAAGAEAGSTIAVLDWDSHRYLECFFAVPMIGAVLQTANIRLASSQLLYTLNHAKAEILLVHRDFWPVIEAIREELSHVRSIIAISDGDAGEIPAWCIGEYEALIQSNRPRVTFIEVDENALATTFYTSGTTGLPKGVCFSHRQIVLHTLASVAAFASAAGPGFRRDDVYMPLTPMFHVHAWGFPFAATMLGMKQVYPGKYEAERLLQLRRDEGATFSHCVPTVLQMVIETAIAAGERLDGWQILIGGSALTPSLYEKATSQGAYVTTGYGMSETCPMISVNWHGDEPYDSTRGGLPIPLVQAKIVDPDNNTLPDDDEALGELVLRSPWLTPCYVDNEPASEALWRGGWMHTQDVASISPSGSIQIRDRLKDVIKSGGEWICSLSLEQIIAAHPDVAEVAVVGVPDPVWQERPVAVIVPREAEKAPTLEAICKTLDTAVVSGEISRYAVIDKLICLDALPLTSTGKIDKKALRAAIADNSAAAAGANG